MLFPAPGASARRFPLSCAFTDPGSALVQPPATTTGDDPTRGPGRAGRLWILSDLHRRSHRDRLETCSIPDADVAVVAGDVSGSLVATVEWLARAVRPHMPVVMVAGNHEFYETMLDLELDRGKEVAARLGVELLENRTVEVAGLRFSGCTLWTDYELDGSGNRSRAMAAAARGMMDHHLILAGRDETGGLRPFRPENALSRHLDSLAFLHGALLRDDAERARQVVVTHHAPHQGSLHPSYAGNPLNPAFVSDLDHLLAAAQPALWVHGHVHSSFDYRVRATRVVCNPKGYGAENPGFDPTLVVEVGHG